MLSERDWWSFPLLGINPKHNVCPWASSFTLISAAADSTAEASHPI